MEQHVGDASPEGALPAAFAASKMALPVFVAFPFATVVPAAPPVLRLAAMAAIAVGIPAAIIFAFVWLSRRMAGRSAGAVVAGAGFLIDALLRVGIPGAARDVLFLVAMLCVGVVTGAFMGTGVTPPQRASASDGRGA